MQIKLMLINAVMINPPGRHVVAPHGKIKCEVQTHEYNREFLHV